MIPLSWSRISDFRQCPHKFNLKYIKKAPNFQIPEDKKSIHLIRGNNVHKGLENYVIARLKGETPKPSSMIEIRNTTPLVDKIMSAYDVQPERQIAVNDKFEVVDWYSKDTWFRVIFDLFGLHKSYREMAIVIDYKTGKFKDYSGSAMELGQLHMFGLTALALWPDRETVDTAYLFVDHKKTIRETFDRDRDYDLMMNNLRAEHQKIQDERDFKATKNEFCMWCDATPDQCEIKKK